jgi:polyisoprenoid-binding protein YceI
MKSKNFLQAVLLCALLAACGQLPAPPAAPPSPQPAATASAPAAAKPAAAPSVSRPAPAAKPPAAGAAAPAPPLHIDAAQSLIAVTVRRGGLLARLGHDHLVAARAISGTVAPAQHRADFQFRLDQLTVDEAPLRTAAGLEKQPSADAIEGTRTNMLTKVLDAGRYPLVTVHAERGAAGQPLQATITLHGVSRTLAIPVEIRETAAGMTVSGAVNLKQSDFGIVPFSLMGGALAVQDQLELKFTLVAH